MPMVVDMLKAIHAAEDLPAATSKAHEVAEKLATMRLLMIGAIEPPRDRRNEATCGSPKSSHPVIAEMRPSDDHRNKAS
jgi:hypothetical protein